MKTQSLGLAALAGASDTEITSIIEQTAADQHEEACRLITLLINQGHLFTQLHAEAFLKKFSPLYNVSHPLLTRLMDKDNTIHLSSLDEPALIHNQLEAITQQWLAIPSMSPEQSPEILRDVLTDFTAETNKIEDISKHTPPMTK